MIEAVSSAPLGPLTGWRDCDDGWAETGAIGDMRRSSSGIWMSVVRRGLVSRLCGQKADEIMCNMKNERQHDMDAKHPTSYDRLQCKR